MVSILRTAENPEPEYEFEPPITLTKRLKDYLEPQVDEKYYLSEKAIYGLKRQEEKDHQPTYLGNESVSAPTIDCRVGALTHFSPYITEPILNQVAQLDGFESTGRIYSKDRLCPTINTMGGGQREPKIIVKGNYMPSGKGNANILDSSGIAQTVMENHGTVQAIVEPKIAEPIAGQFQPSDRDYNIKGKERDERFELRDDLLANAILTGDKKNCVVEPYLIDPQGRLNKECKPLDNCPTLRAQTHGNPPQVVEPQLRIRKLTPLECWRLMGISDEDFHKAKAVVSDSQLFRQAGNGIVVDVFMAVLRPLFSTK